MESFFKHGNRLWVSERLAWERPSQFVQRVVSACITFQMLNSVLPLLVLDPRALPPSSSSCSSIIPLRLSITYWGLVQRRPAEVLRGEGKLLAEVTSSEKTDEGSWALTSGIACALWGAGRKLRVPLPFTCVCVEILSVIPARSGVEARQWIRFIVIKEC